jgi:hypothetical protein
MATAIACGARSALLEEGAPPPSIMPGADAGGPEDASPPVEVDAGDASPPVEAGVEDASPPVDAGVPDADAAPPPDLTPDFAWYRLDETSGTVAHDSSPNHYDIPGLAGVRWGDGATFDGANVCGRIDVDASFRTPPVTITAWLTPAARADEGAPAYGLQPFPPNAVSGDVPGLGGFGIGADVWTDGLPPGTLTRAALGIESGVGVTTGFHSLPVPFTPSARHFVAAVEDTGSVTVYVDGAVLAASSSNLPPPVSPTPLHLGCHNDDTGYASTRFFKGTIRDARIFKSLLTTRQIAALYQSGPAP